MPAANIGLAIWRLKCFYETFVQGSTAVILLNFCAKNPPHRQAENRWQKILKTVLKIRSNYLKSYNRKVGKTETATKNNLKVGKSKFNIV